MSGLFFIKPEIPEDIVNKFTSSEGDDILDETETKEETNFVSNVLSHINDDVNEQSDDYEIKVTGDERTFEDGFVRYTKEGKGRYDLIPFEVICDHMTLIDNQYQCVHSMYNSVTINYSKFSIIKYISGTNELHGAIANIVAMHYYAKDHATSVSLSRDQYADSFIRMLQDLSIHFEKGAAKYGENNWRKGTNELWSFIDSGRRHTMQYLNGQTDEPHFISAIWNFVCYLALTREAENQTDLGIVFSSDKAKYMK